MSFVRTRVDLEGLCCIWAAQSSAQQRLFAIRLPAWRPVVRRDRHVASLGEYHEGDSNFVSRLIKDEQGGEVLEYALIAGLIVVAAIAVIGSVGGKVLARWNSLEQQHVSRSVGWHENDRQARLPAGVVRVGICPRHAEPNDCNCQRGVSSSGFRAVGVRFVGSHRPFLTPGAGRLDNWEGRSQGARALEGP